jgi:hypothetical protein
MYIYTISQLGCKSPYIHTSNAITNTQFAKRRNKQASKQAASSKHATTKLQQLRSSKHATTKQQARSKQQVASSKQQAASKQQASKTWQVEAHATTKHRNIKSQWVQVKCNQQSIYGLVAI